MRNKTKATFNIIHAKSIKKQHSKLPFISAALSNLNQPVNSCLIMIGWTSHRVTRAFGAGANQA